ncbi:protein UXT isoform X1 [Hypanus sabinus]|uniref:protein UXT isoform X1 n=1 Tax=Hypanus sabinus TaxID=79690 RepID=UPI0028C50534|nr:protein UXT isoform X1 [Hypanus sabinus]
MTGDGGVRGSRREGSGIRDVRQRRPQAGSQVLEQRDEVYEKIAQYLQLKNVIERLQESDEQQLKMEVDLGCNFYVQAKVPDASKIFLLVGYGFYVEFTLPEALRFIERKSQQLSEVAEKLSKDSAKIKGNIRMVLQALCELQGIKDLPEEGRSEIL